MVSACAKHSHYAMQEHMSSELIERQRQALKLVDAIIALAPDDGTLDRAMVMREKLKLPMSVVLDKLGLTPTEMTQKLGVHRNVYHHWMNGHYRPDERMAKKLAKLTGFEWEDIRGQRLLRRR
jgi:DNA-binding XRE family transcriptional regulator